MTCTSPGEQSSVVADIARSDPVLELPGRGQTETEGREKGDDTGEELSDRSDGEEWEVVETVRQQESVKTERIVGSSTEDDVVIPQNLPDPEHQGDTTEFTAEAGLAEEALVQRVAVEEGEQLRDDGFTVIRRLTTMHHIRTEFGSPRFRGDEPRKVEKLLGTEMEEHITELAPGVELPYSDDAEVETMWDEFEDYLPDGTWIKKKTTRTTVHPPPSAVKTSTTMEPAITQSLEGTGQFDHEKSALVDSGYRDDTSHELIEEDVVQLVEADKSDMASEKSSIQMVSATAHGLAGREGMILKGT